MTMNVLIVDEVYSMTLTSEHDIPRNNIGGGSYYAPAVSMRPNVQFVCSAEHKKDIGYTDINAIWCKGWRLHGYLESVSVDGERMEVTMGLIRETERMSLEEFQLEYLL